mgnify:CR=1 FL=1
MITLRIPATSANLGAGFDSLGLALSMYNEVQMEEYDGIDIQSADDVAVPTDQSNLIYSSARRIYELCGKPFPGLRIVQTNNIPMTRGLGSSSACIIAGICRANHMLGHPFTRNDLVNMAAYGFFYNLLGIHNLISNALAWAVAVLFAYAVNKLFVFQSRTGTATALAREFGLFIAARLFSFGVDELCMGLLVNALHANGGISKIAVNVIVMLINYFFSKRVIFKKDAPPERPAE